MYIIGVEADPIIEEVPSMVQLLAGLPDYAGQHENIFLYRENAAAQEAVSLLAEAGILVEKHPLYQFDAGEMGELFWDYGFQLDPYVYLFKEMVEAFILSAPSKEAEHMARLQLSEHLVFTVSQSDAHGPISLLDKELGELAIRIAKAYGCQVLFLTSTNN